MSFLYFCFSSNWEREREWYTKFVYKGEMAPKLLILFFDGIPLKNLSSFRGFILFFYTGLKNLGPLVSQIFFCLQPGVNGYGSVCHEPCSKTNFLTIYFRWRGGAPLPFWGPSQSFGFSLPPLPVSGDQRLLSTNTCWYPLCDPHSLLTVTFLTSFHCSFQREDSINLTSIVSAGYHVTVMMGWGFLKFWRTCLGPCLQLPKSPYLYRDILEQIEGSRMFGDTSENYRETCDNSCMIILKSRLNPVGHSARTR